MEVYAAVRHFVFVEGRSRREAARVFGLNRETVAKICRFSVPPGYRREQPAARPKLGPFIPVIDAILEADRGALLDRLAHHVHILEMNGESYRLKQSRARRRKNIEKAGDEPSHDPKTGEINDS